MKLLNFEARFCAEELNKLFKTNLKTSTEMSICTDSRVIKSGQIFLPLKGELFDGHNYVNSVFEKFLKRKDNQTFSFCEKKKINKVKKKFRNRLIIVRNALDAYHRLANYYRKKNKSKSHCYYRKLR